MSKTVAYAKIMTFVTFYDFAKGLGFSTLCRVAQFVLYLIMKHIKVITIRTTQDRCTFSLIV